MNDIEMVDRALLAPALRGERRTQVEGLQSWLLGDAKSLTRSSGRVLTERRRAWMVKLLQELDASNAPPTLVTEIQCGPLPKTPPGVVGNSPRQLQSACFRYAGRP